MENIKGSKGVYRPIRVMFDTPIYERAVQTCWHMGSYKCQIALVYELLRLQQNNQLPSEVTAEDIIQFLVEESKSTLRVQLWEFELEDYDADVRPLLKLAWGVNTSMKMRDVEFEARRLLTSPEAAPPQIQHPKIISQAQTYARSLTEQQQEARGPKLLGPREVVMELVPKVLQGFWLPPPTTSFNMPSQQLCIMAVGVTKAVEDRVSTALSSMRCQVPFSRSIRDDLVLSIQEKVRQGEAKDVLVKKLNCFAKDVLKTITEVAAVEIRALFQSQTVTTVSSATREQPTLCLELKSNVAPAPSPPEHRGEEPTKEPDTAFVLAPPPPETPPAEVTSSVLDTKNKNEESTKEPPSVVDSAPPPTMTSPAVIIPSVLDPEDRGDETTRDSSPPVITDDEPPVIIAKQAEPVQQPTPNTEPPSVTPPVEVTTSVLDGENKNEEPPKETDSAVASTPPPPISPPAVIIPSVLDPEHRGEEPTREIECALVLAPPACVTLLTELPVIIKVQDEPMINTDPSANTGLDEAEEESVPTSEPDSAVVTTPPPLIPSDEDPVIIKVQDEPMTNAEPTANTGLDEAEEESVPTSEPDSAVATTSPPLVPSDEDPVIIKVQDEPMINAEPTANTGLDEAEEESVPTSEPDSAVVTTPPPLIPSDEDPVITEVQDELIITEQPVKVDESLCTTTKVKKTKKRGFSSFRRWLQKKVCCCFRPEDDREME